jgi:hypothetical protein
VIQLLNTSRLYLFSLAIAPKQREQLISARFLLKTATISIQTQERLKRGISVRFAGEFKASLMLFLSTESFLSGRQEFLPSDRFSLAAYLLFALISHGKLDHALSQWFRSLTTLLSATMITSSLTRIVARSWVWTCIHTPSQSSNAIRNCESPLILS